MTELVEVYRCNVCGNMVEVVRGSTGTLVCCGQNMERMSEKAADMGKEKHVPVIQVSGNKLTVKVGSIPHPMEEKHFIEWIEILTDRGSERKWLKPEMSPEADFCLPGKISGARAFCNVHGLWKSS